MLQYRARQKRMASACTPAGAQRDQVSKETEQELRDVLARDPTDERTYVILGTLLLRQRRVEEARETYEEGCAVAQGSNAYIWTAMGNLEKRVRTFLHRILQRSRVGKMKMPVGLSLFAKIWDTHANHVSFIFTCASIDCAQLFTWSESNDLLRRRTSRTPDSLPRRLATQHASSCC